VGWELKANSWKLHLARRIRMHETLCALLISTACVAAVQSSASADWIGVWQGELDGQPSVILTLAADGGMLEGTLVLNGISRDGGAPRVAVREAHVLLHPQVNGTTLSFEVKHLRGSATSADFTVEMSSSGNAKIHCLNCGDNAPVIEIAKQD
jgi:hypothetical protein